MRFLLFTSLLVLSLTAQASEPVGSYTNGKIVNAEYLPEVGEGYVHLFQQSDKMWGTHEMISLIQETAKEMLERYPNRDRLQVEEISAQNGGDIPDHSSHENGLDADIGYFKSNNREYVSTPLRPYADSMVQEGIVSENFDLERNWELLKALHRHGEVRRVFMDQILKNELCRYSRSINDYQKNTKVLASIVHVDNHRDHLHVRLACPKYAKNCKSHAAIGANSGCPAK